MTTKPHTLVLGDLVAAAFDRAEVVTEHADLQAELATRTAARWLARLQRHDLMRALNRDAVSAPARRMPRAGGLRAA